MARRLPPRVALVTTVAGLGALAVSLSPGATAAHSFTQKWSISNVGPFGGEPSLTTDAKGVLYDMTPAGGMRGYRSTDHGRSWKPTTIPDPSSGDDCLTTDQTGAVYACNLAGSNDGAPLQADVWKSTNGGKSWLRATNTVTGNASSCGTSCSPFGVDRDWIAASVPKKGDPTSKAVVALMYHDFYGPTSIWINKSVDGGRTFTQLDNVMATPAITPGAISGSIDASGYTFCSTVPAGVGIVPPGKPHAGRIIVGWIA